MVVKELGVTLRLHRSTEITGGEATKAKPTPPVECACGRKIQIGKSVLAEGPIVCGVCGT